MNETPQHKSSNQELDKLNAFISNAKRGDFTPDMPKWNIVEDHRLESPLSEVLNDVYSEPKVMLYGIL